MDNKFYNDDDIIPETNFVGKPIKIVFEGEPLTEEEYQTALFNLMIKIAKYNSHIGL